MADTLTTGKAAERLGVTVKTMQRWERDKVLIPAGRTTTNRRVYTVEQIAAHQGLRITCGKEASRIIAYCRVSSTAQKPDLKNQRKVLEEFCTVRGLANVEFIEEVGGGLNFKRKQFVALMDDIGMRQIKTLVIAHRDRLTRFGFEWFEHYAKISGCEVLVLNQERLSPEQEMVQDLMTIVHCFSSRLYGLRNYKKKLKEALEHDKTDETKEAT
jgi:predicted site-specific integrase-resolvase